MLCRLNLQKSIATTNQASSRPRRVVIMASTCVITGVTGYIAAHIGKIMVDKGYTVRGTVRSVTNPRSMQLAEVFKTLPGEGKLVLFEADILKQESLTDALFEGAEYVFHVASPFQIKGEALLCLVPMTTHFVTVVREEKLSPQLQDKGWVSFEASFS